MISISPYCHYRTLRSAVALLLGGPTALVALCLSGCSPAATQPVRHVAAGARVVRVADRGAESALSPAALVQTSAQFQAAREACSAGKYGEAADILGKLALSPGFDDDQRAFCRKQQEICLGHLGKRLAGTADQHDRAKASRLRTSTGEVSLASGSDCGPRALLIACERLNVKTNLEAITKAAGTDAHGTTLAGLKRAAIQVLGLKAEGVQAGRQAIGDMPMPAIAWTNGSHFIAVLAVSGHGESGRALIHDPNEPAERTIGLERLLQLSGGYLLTLRK